MDIEKFKQSPIGKLVHIEGVDAYGRAFDHYAYLPNPLPERLPLADSTWRLLTDTVLELGRLGGEGDRLPNPGLLARPLIRAEAVSSSALEGTYTTLPQVFQSELFQDSPSLEVTEVLDQIRAFEHGVKVVNEGGALGVNLVKHLHAMLMKNDPRCPPSDKGEFRKRQNFIGPHPKSRVEESYFVPPPQEAVTSLIYDWEKWMHDAKAAHVLVRAAVGHYQFETIHPFIDGNGRLGRLLALLLLLHDGKTLRQPLLNISPYLEAHRTEYQEQLRRASITGDFDSWVCFFLEGVRSRAEIALQKIAELRAIGEAMVNNLRAKRVRGTGLRLAQEAIGFPFITTTDVRDRYKITYQGASQAIAIVVKAGYYTPISLGGNRKLFMCEDVMRIVESV